MPVHDGWGGVGLPQPLSAASAARIRRIFALQAQGDIPAAVTETGALQDDMLLGDILADRYLGERHGDLAGPALTSALSGWLRNYGTQADAPAIHALLVASLPHGAKVPPAPDTATLGPEASAAPPPEEADPAAAALHRNPLLDRTVRERSGRNLAGARSALRLIARTPGLDPLYGAQLRAEVALDLFTQGEDDVAEATALDAYARSAQRLGLPAYIAGLAAWRAGRADRAAVAFEQASRAPLAAASLRAGAALWAARAHLRQGDVANYAPWLERAASAPRTFYGLLAARMLGRRQLAMPVASFARGAQSAPQNDTQNSTAAVVADRGNGTEPAPRPVLAEAVFRSPQSGEPELTPQTGQPVLTSQTGEPVLGEIDIEAVAATSAGRRAFALLQVGQTARAEATLRRLWPKVQNDAPLCRSIMLVARAAGLNDLAAQTASLLQARDGQPRDAERFPTPRFRPANGYTTDPALVYALARLESNFDAGAVSGAGAHGLMQLMPVTAGFVTGKPDRYAGSPSRLHDPSLNLAIGQRYVAYLAQSGAIDGNLIKLLASYNAGPGAVSRWASVSEDDPLLFIESIPVDETRDFVRRALTYLWIYGARLDLPSPSLTALAQGGWPGYDQEARLATGSTRIH